MYIRRARKTTTAKKSKKTYTIDGKTYNSKPLYDYHQELTAYQKDGIIKSFYLPEASEIQKSKFHAIKATINDIQFDSLNESRYYIKLLQEKKAGIIKSFEMQQSFLITPSYKKNGKTIRKMEYLADFVIQYPDGSTRVIDVKGVETDVFKMKKKLVEYMYPDVTIECVRWVPKESKWMTLKEYKEYTKNKKKKAA